MRSVLDLYLAARAVIAGRSDDEVGATATEYAILVAVIALVLVIGAAFFGGQLSSWFTNLGGSVSGGF